MLSTFKCNSERRFSETNIIANAEETLALYILLTTQHLVRDISVLDNLLGRK
jgi:hypothetical protein